MDFKTLAPYRDAGWTVVRVGLGAMMMVHGYPKITGGIERWTKLGGAMESFGITFAPAFWGFMAAFAEFFGGLFIVLGALTSISALLVVFTMLVAAIRHLSSGDSLADSAHPIEVGLAFLGILFIGAGKYSLDAWWKNRK